jgi:thioredoxin-like negative regulator of GroEL
VDAESFDDLIAGPPVLVHFWAPWNPYDKPLDAELAALRPAFAKKLRFYSANADDTAFTPIIDAHHIAALPTLLCFANGRARGRFHGIQTAEALKAFLEEMTAPAAR